ncbi:uncharacterized protein LOC117567778 isoform X1 [Drosophila albomicans]|uniref:Uncharacterized protein LOC117567778 isoform X1 n=1 Tax=Drosophila albomicans TaxID=7291 RepID=A0A6P8Y5D2_DROAB|nr:uncharacterized protein LOC117567778 isoform X1 [Drosophila albomicans]XP_051858005.1 uncharacterized protein LOC117567778 isoform X1 [Drosophila albomicans]XP_051858009.1 uncharacterized protein LOC117567778 isoform X1 [Drosophila albomicans]
MMMMANTNTDTDPELDKENNKRSQQQTMLGTTIGQRFVIPQLKIPQLNLGHQPNTAEALAAQEAQHRAADAHNELLLNEIKRRREQQKAASSSVGDQLPTLGGFTIPKLRTASGEALEEPQLNIPLLNKLRSQNNSLTEVTQVEQGVKKLKIATETLPQEPQLNIPLLNKLHSQNNSLTEVTQVEQGVKKLKIATETVPLIDLTTAVIAMPKDAPPREAATKVSNRKATLVTEHFDIPFIGCDGLRSRLNAGLLSKTQLKTQTDIESQPIVEIEEKSSIIGKFMDRSVGYPQPRKPQLKYAASQLELQHLKMCQRQDYGSNLKRFLFDTPSPDERIKEALQKSWRISRT